MRSKYPFLFQEIPRTESSEGGEEVWHKTRGGFYSPGRVCSKPGAGLTARVGLRIHIGGREIREARVDHELIRHQVEGINLLQLNAPANSTKLKERTGHEKLYIPKSSHPQVQQGYFFPEERRKTTTMDDYTREMMELKTLVTRTLEKKGVLAKIRAELRASVFEAIEEEDKAIEKDEGLPPALLGSCNDRARQLHASPSGRLLTALVCEYLDWAQLSHTLKVYLPECNLQKDAWKSELKDFSNKNGYDINRNGDSDPLLLDVLEGFLKFENQSQVRSGGRRPEQDSLTNFDSRNRRPSSSSIIGGLPPLGRQIPASHASDRRGGPLNSGYRKDDYNRRYDNDDMPEDIMRASAALENLQLDRKTRNLTSSWRHGGDGSSEEDGRVDHMQIYASHASDQKEGALNLGYRKYDYNRRYDTDDMPEDILQASATLENLQLDRKARNLTLLAVSFSVKSVSVKYNMEEMGAVRKMGG
ncbi:hypothetical protein L1887_16502 [Cichorium endivia]|nr:hypothetical protein L1887_16502 [Cichorium endivia]